MPNAAPEAQRLKHSAYQHHLKACHMPHVTHHVQHMALVPVPAPVDEALLHEVAVDAAVVGVGAVVHPALPAAHRHGAGLGAAGVWWDDSRVRKGSQCARQLLLHSRCGAEQRKRYATLASTYACTTTAVCIGRHTRPTRPTSQAHPQPTAGTPARRRCCSPVALAVEPHVLSTRGVDAHIGCFCLGHSQVVSPAGGEGKFLAGIALQAERALAAALGGVAVAALGAVGVAGLGHLRMWVWAVVSAGPWRHCYVLLCCWWSSVRWIAGAGAGCEVMWLIVTGSSATGLFMQLQGFTTLLPSSPGRDWLLRCEGPRQACA